MLYGHTELVHQEEREIARHARDIKSISRISARQESKAMSDPALRQPACHRRNSMTLPVTVASFMPYHRPTLANIKEASTAAMAKQLIAGCPKGYDNQGRQQRPDGTAAISSHLENRLCQTLLPPEANCATRDASDEKRTSPIR